MIDRSFNTISGKGGIDAFVSCFTDNAVSGSVSLRSGHDDHLVSLQVAAHECPTIFPEVQPSQNTNPVWKHQCISFKSIYCGLVEAWALGQGPP
jgi:hypothetical protein